MGDAVLQGIPAAPAGVPVVDLDAAAVDRSLTRIVNRRYARCHQLLPIRLVDDTLTVAMLNPQARGVVDDLVRSTGLVVEVVTSTRVQIERALRRLYDHDVRATDQLATDLFRQVLTRALDNRCSDIHLETMRDRLSVRFRIDGLLRQPALGPLQRLLDKHAREVISRIKILSDLDIAERRRPQDGSFQQAVARDGATVAIDLRVSVLPCHFGESVVIRVLDRSRAPRGLEDLELSAAVGERMARSLAETTGIILVTGPTGSGKSTTLYACLMHLHRPEVRILTAENPVEYIYDELSQSEVRQDLGNTFSAYLRAFLRHDPEVIMVGEIRDRETAEIAFQAAQTGHLLLSTLHTNTAVAAVSRLRDLGVEPSLLASSLVAVLSQRLTRRICSRCRILDDPDSELVEVFFEARPTRGLLHRGGGCSACGFTGYRGRALVTDVWTPDAQDARAIARDAPPDVLADSARRTSVSMADDAHARLSAGVTTLAELRRVLPASAIAEFRQRYGTATLNEEDS